MDEEYPYLTREEVSKAVAEIASLDSASAQANGLYVLYVLVLRTIAEGGLSEGHAEALAEEALKGCKIDFARIVSDCACPKGGASP